MIYYDSLTKTGGRAVNEDCIGSLRKNGQILFALADGLGGHGGGDIASALAVSKALEIFEESMANCELALCFAEGQKALMIEQGRSGRHGDMKTTLVLLMIDENSAVWGHIGDSRLYVFEEGNVTFRTKDHSVPQMLVNTGEISEEEIRFHPDRNRLLRALGDECESPRFEMSKPSIITPGMSFLLCTDGFWELIDETEMLRELDAASTPEEWLAVMEKTVVRRGDGKNMDNYSAIGVWIR